ncbi:glycoside hydrolase family 3 protein [Salinimonas sp. HHU 13199]|uniref:Glycoside hydrolase family 3 protein n=1 Tax=Salinimonas profundi TaxID=2729140 RepID=A0ABR8LJT1_9ALTE|nr:glycoside hydrolase family 3 N-terminal domain-containing protein [Salinimonas profundi]MBD3586457.1 glycoside hydrolase family 3 protein [Salinimonas profundi]
MKPVFKQSLSLIAAALLISGCQQKEADTTTDTAATAAASTMPPSADAKVPDYWPEITFEVENSDEVEAKVDALLADMTLEQKVAQIMQPEIRDVTVEDMRKYGFGSYLNGGGSFPDGNKQATLEDWISLADKMYEASVDDSLDGSTIPTMWGTDAVHGHNNVIGATLFPHNIGLGAMHEPQLMKEIATATAKEVRATGIDWIFAPTVATARDDRWGRTYESYSEDPEIVGQYARAIVSGLQGDLSDGNIDEEHVVSTVKHFVGDGGTDGGDDQGNNLADEETLYRIHAQGYVHGLNAGAQSVMASFNSWHGKKIHGSKYLLTNVLKEKMGFDGFVVGDWNGHGQIEGCTNESCPQAINAGLDVYMVPTDAWKPLFENTVAQVKSGEISQERLDDAVRRVLRVKMRVGLFDLPSPANRALSAKADVVGSDEHRAVAREAVRKSLVMLKNQDNLLPLSPDMNVLVAGDAADNIGKQSGGWTITWQGTGNKNSDFPGATSIYSGIEQAVSAAGGTATLSEDGSFEEKPDAAIVVFGENPYAEGNGDLSNLEYQRGDKTDLALLRKLKSQGIPVISVFITGRPLWTNPEINASDAFVVAWLPGSEGQGVADVLFTDKNGDVDYPMQGKLSFSWPAKPTQIVNKDDGQKAQFAYGYGLRYGEDDPITAPLSEEAGADEDLVLAHDIFVRDIQKPWHLEVLDADGQHVMTSNTMSVKGADVRTTDRNVQEDTLELTFKDKATVRFAAQFPEDLRDYLSDSAAIQMAVQLSQADADVQISMMCGEDCEGSVALQDFAQQTTQWQDVAIPTQCLKDAGVAFDEVFSVLGFSASAPVTLKVSDIRIEPSMQDVPTCP